MFDFDYDVLPVNDVDGSHPLASGLVFAAPLNVPATFARDGVTGTFGTVGSGITRRNDYLNGIGATYAHNVPQNPDINTLEFAAGSTGLTFANKPIWNLNLPCSFSFWVSPNWTAGSAGYNPCILAMRDGGGTRFSIHVGASGGDFGSIGIYNGGSYQTGTFSGSTTFAARPRWVHVVLSWISGTVCTIYMNGTAAANLTQTMGASTTASLRIGNSTGAAEAFIGGIGLPTIWSRGLSGTEARTLYTDPYTLYRNPTIFLAQGVSTAVTGSGGITFQVQTLAGLGAPNFTGLGGLIFQKPTLVGAGSRGNSGSGGLVFQKPGLAGVGTYTLLGTGDLTLSVPSMLGAGLVLGPPPVHTTQIAIDTLEQTVPIAKVTQVALDTLEQTVADSLRRLKLTQLAVEILIPFDCNLPPIILFLPPGCPTTLATGSGSSSSGCTPQIPNGN